jgi:hypothetical protein
VCVLQRVFGLHVKDLRYSPMSLVTIVHINCDITQTGMDSVTPRSLYRCRLDTPLSAKENRRESNPDSPATELVA